MPHRRSFRSVTALSVAVASAATLGAGAVGSAQAAVGPDVHRAHVRPLVSPAGSPDATAQFRCQSRPIDGSLGPRCYSPAQIQTAYQLAPLQSRGLRGKGRTIVILDAFQNPYIENDLAQFDAKFGLPTPMFEQIAPLGLTPFDPNDPYMVAWAEEISIDVQWAHVTAPDARIVLALAPSDQDVDLFGVARYVVKHRVGDVLSQSFGQNEACFDPAALPVAQDAFAEAARQGITVLASSGDSGAAQVDCTGTGAALAASYPASDPRVTGVGGTTLNAALDGTWLGETAWTEPFFGCNPPAVATTDINCSGGGFSTIFRRPSYQRATAGIPASSRGVPDVAYDAGINAGLLTNCGICNVESGLPPTDPAFYIFGGTSVGAPQWAGLVATADQLAHRDLGLINPTLYAISHTIAYRASFHDITDGNNDVTELGTGYNATNSWDPVTGLGTPKATALVPLLALGGSF
ncbi:MAG: hypothetical protein QOE76_125 [Frankiales bacterium]|nr:hypothetical protein [Frankiales bacterium]